MTRMMNILLQLLTIFILLLHVVSSELIEHSVVTAIASTQDNKETQEATRPLHSLRGLEDIQVSCSNQHEEFVRCRSSSCFDKTCYQVRNPGAIRPCTRDCKSGCACKDGYVRHSDGLCYKENICYSA
mmetsp:Transcript_16829/g.31876  ORF Transcript_16829/g.31876 Transcript_16829/m.31876 type:complete len:128 (+) Transcript_16829:114-497(+)